MSVTYGKTRCFIQYTSGERLSVDLGAGADVLDVAKAFRKPIFASTGKGDDVYIGGGGYGYIRGGSGIDRLNGGDGNDRIYNAPATALSVGNQPSGLGERIDGGLGFDRSTRLASEVLVGVERIVSA